MPPRGVPDQITEARMREVIRSILNQEVRRLLAADSSLLAQVTTNTGDIATNATAITIHSANIEYNLRRLLADVGGGEAVQSMGAGAAGVVEHEFFSIDPWTLTVPSPPQVTLWKLTTATLNAFFDSTLFDTVLFDDATMIRSIMALSTTTTIEYDTATKVLSISWGAAKTGTLYLLTLGNGMGYAIVAIAD